MLGTAGSRCCTERNASLGTLGLQPTYTHCGRMTPIPDLHKVPMFVEGVRYFVTGAKWKNVIHPGRAACMVVCVW